MRCKAGHTPILVLTDRRLGPSRLCAVCRIDIPAAPTAVRTKSEAAQRKPRAADGTFR